jgi:hypothetical protein
MLNKFVGTIVGTKKYPRRAGIKTAGYAAPSAGWVIASSLTRWRAFNLLNTTYVT